MGGQVIQEYMSFRMTCIMGTFVLKKIMLSRTTLWENMFYWMAYLTG